MAAMDAAGGGRRGQRRPKLNGQRGRGEGPSHMTSKQNLLHFSIPSPLSAKDV